MVLVDTSIWIDHLRCKDEQLSSLLECCRVGIHPMIIGELACGHLHQREVLMALWRSLPHVTEATHNEAMYCLETHNLSGKGIGFIDLHLLASTLLTANTVLWTRDHRLKQLAQSLHVLWSVVH